uniref:C-type lectin domain-containing protein n=1 Tax=Panagrolaimus sp. JU765 TaxID=591449 RepID=A0AC34Q3N0_9BILA
MLIYNFILVIVVIVVQHVVEGIDVVCPPGAVNLSKTCYTFSSAPATFSEARFHCNEQNGTLAVIDSAFTNTHIAEIAGKYWVDFWIGAILTTFDLDDGKVRIWTWDGLDKFLNYKDWGFNEPSNKGGCAAVKTSDGTWFADDCSTKKNYVCSIPMQIDVCDDQWTYYSVTGFCYKVYYHLGWNNAENNCAALKAHLVSIHSKEENDFVQGKQTQTKLR